MATVHVRHDSQRGCGWRKPGGLYLVSDGLAMPCGALPVPLCRCPTCGNGIKASRGWTWVDAAPLLAPAVALCEGPPAQNPSRSGFLPACARCPLGGITGRHGLLWIGGSFYPTPDAFTREAQTLGVSRRIIQLPKGLKIGETWVFVAHREAIPSPCSFNHPYLLTEGDVYALADCERCKGTRVEHRPGIFHAFKPSAVEYVVKGDESDDVLDKLEKRGITPVRVERVAPTPELTLL